MGLNHNNNNNNNKGVIAEVKYNPEALLPDS